jgi:hypothetical protein
MTAHGVVVVGLFYRAECLRCGWLGEERKDSEDAHGDRRLHQLAHVTDDIRKGGGKR